MEWSIIICSRVLTRHCGRGRCRGRESGNLHCELTYSPPPVNYCTTYFACLFRLKKTLNGKHARWNNDGRKNTRANLAHTTIHCFPGSCIKFPIPAECSSSCQVHNTVYERESFINIISGCSVRGTSSPRLFMSRFLIGLFYLARRKVHCMEIWGKMPILHLTSRWCELFL